MMTLTRDFKETLAAGVRRDPEFVRAFVAEAISLFKNGEAETAKQILADLLNASVEPKSLTAELGDPRHEAMVAIYETMQALHQIGALDGETMDEIDRACRAQNEALQVLREAVEKGLQSAGGRSESAQVVFDRLEAKYLAMIRTDGDSACGSR